MSSALVVPKGGEEVPEEKVTQLKQAFTLLDRSNDGAIKPKDLKAFMEALGHECTEVELEDMVSECNKAAGAHGEEGERHGEIDFKAFYTAMLPTLKTNPEAQDSEAFKVCRRRLSLTSTPRPPLAVAASAVVRLGPGSCPEPPISVPRAQMFDKDGKGFVTVDEMKRKMCSVIPSFPEAEAEATFKETAGDEGKITYADFQKTMARARAPKPGEAAA